MVDYLISFFWLFIFFSGDILVMILARKNGIKHWRNVIGPTQTSKARDEVHDRYKKNIILCFCIQTFFFVSIVASMKP